MYFNYFSPIIMTVMVLLSVAFITLLERKVLSLVGLRLGPNKVIFIGLGQPLMDALKLFQKQVNFIMNFSSFFYYSSACIMMFCTMMMWSCISWECMFSPKCSLLFIMLMMGINTVASIMAGWSVFSKFSLMGSIRTVSLMISYESMLYLIILIMMFFSSSVETFSIRDKTLEVCLALPCLLMLWTPSMLADLNRTPCDFSESESELVSGFNTEFGSSSFTLIFLAEYSNIILMSFLTMVFFLPSYNIIFSGFIFAFVIWIRSVLPRMRFDKLMKLAWVFLIPFCTMMFILWTMTWS